MGAVDLLFKPKPESERLHQAALTVLFQATPLLGQLLGRPIPAPRVAWEPEGGAFDLRVDHAGGEKSIFIELKVDGRLSWPQIHRQTGRTASPGKPICILLGISAITRGERWGHWRTLEASARPKLYSAADLQRALEAIVAAILEKDVRELAESYIRVLEELAMRTQRYRGKPIEAFDHRDYLGYFDDLRQAVDFGGSTVECVSNARGGFVCCAWKAVPNENGGLYLQFENQSLCVRSSPPPLLRPRWFSIPSSCSVAAALARP